MTMNDGKSNITNNIQVIVLDKLSPQQETEVSNLQKIAFTEVSDSEAEEDFFNQEVAQVLAYLNNTLVGWAGLHQTEQEYEGKRIKLGGYGICTHPEYQGKGIGSMVASKAMEELRNKGVEVGFLSVDSPKHLSVGLHKKYGFVMFPRKFSWMNARGELDEDENGMIAPINSQELFEYVLNGKDKLYVGEGYW